MSIKYTMTVFYYRPVDEASGRRLVYSYLLTTDGKAVNGRITVSITNTQPVEPEGALPSGIFTVVAEDVAIALVGAQVQINDHHSGLKPVAGAIQAGRE